jgi:hypothetical protein
MVLMFQEQSIVAVESRVLKYSQTFEKLILNFSCKQVNETLKIQKV